MRSGKYYRTNQEGDQSFYSSVTNFAMHNLPSTPYLSPPRDQNSPPEDDMTSQMKLPSFKDVGDEDMDRFWFIVGSVWTVQNVVTNSMKRAQLSLDFEGRTLEWYMGYLDQHENVSIEDIKDALKQQFKNPKAYS